MSALLVTRRGSINAWECDQWGHMNVQFYLAKASDAQAALAASLGLGPSRLRQAGQGVLTVADRILFKRELRAGDTFCVHSGVRGIAADGTLDFASRMTNTESGVEAASFETRARLVDLTSGQALGWPDDALARARELTDEHVDVPPPKPMAHAQPPVRDLDRLILSYRGSIESWECEEGGIVPPRFHIARFADCANHLFRELGLNKASMRANNLGSAALDYEIDYHRPMRVGQVVETRSGMLDAGDKVFHFFHHLIDSSSGELITSIVVAALFFDLVARKSVAMPEPVRARAERLIATSLS